MMNLKTNLMPHQVPAVEKMMPTRVGALFMEMGTGKSRTAIEIIHRRQARISKVVWFCPVSLKETIRHEVLKHTDSSDSKIHVFGQKTDSDSMPKAFWYVVGIESMSLSSRVILSIASLVDTTTAVIVDESSFIKGHLSSRTRWITQLSENAKYRMILTGTPISQGVVDLFAQFRFLSPKILGYRSFYSFASNHLEYSDKFPGKIERAHNTEWLAAKISPYVYQITKEECLSLPSKTYSSRFFSMTERQRTWYEKIKDDFISEINYEKFDSYAIFQLFSQLQQIVCGFLNINSEGKQSSRVEFQHERIACLIDVIDSIECDKKFIIWAKYEYDILSITEALEIKFGSGSVSQFYGKVKPKDRYNEINKFEGYSRFFVATESCGGHGLTLNGAHYVVFYNNGFKFAERLQAEDRCHRIGQKEKVTYVDIVCRDSIDERIQDGMAAKESVVESFKKEVDAIKTSKTRLKSKIRRL